MAATQAKWHCCDIILHAASENRALIAVGAHSGARGSVPGNIGIRYNAKLDAKYFFLICYQLSFPDLDDAK